MKYIALYSFMLFVGIPLIGFSIHLATMPDEARQDLSEAAKDLNGRIYTARISCGRGRQDHVVRVHGRSPQDARRKIQAQVRDCAIEISKTASKPVWQKALRKAY